MKSHAMNITSSDYSIYDPGFYTFPVISSSPQIKFSFTCSLTISFYRQNSLITRHQLPLQANIPISLEQFHSYPETYAFITEKIKHMPIFDSQVIDDLIKTTYRHAEEAIAATPETDVYVYCGLIAHHYIAVMVPVDDSSSLGSCGVCLEEFSELCATTPCKHVFHIDCITKWLRINRSCPICRSRCPSYRC